jgi:hypothetical protein
MVNDIVRVGTTTNPYTTLIFIPQTSPPYASLYFKVKERIAAGYDADIWFLSNPPPNALQVPINTHIDIKLSYPGYSDILILNVDVQNSVIEIHNLQPFSGIPLITLDQIQFLTSSTMQGTIINATIPICNNGTGSFQGGNVGYLTIGGINIGNIIAPSIAAGQCINVTIPLSADSSGTFNVCVNQ